jgi:hypothetical protein
LPVTSTSFQPGNTASVTHGGRSPRLRQEARRNLVQEYRDQVLSVLPELSPADYFLVDLLTHALADVRQLDDWIEKVGGPVDARGRVMKAMEMRRAREHDVFACLDRLGVGPRARAILIKASGGSSMAALQRATEAQARIRASLAASVDANGQA